MADNITVKDASGSNVVVRATDDTSVFTPHQNIDALPGTVETDIAAIKTAVEVIDNAISGSEMQVDVVSLPGTVATNISTLAAAVSGSEMQVDVLTLPNVTMGAALPTGTNTIGNVGIAEKTIVLVTGTASTSGDNTLIAAQGSGVKIVVTAIMLQNESTSSTTYILKDGSTAKMRFLANNKGDGVAMALPLGREWKMTANTALVLNLSAANSTGYTIAYYTE